VSNNLADSQILYSVFCLLHSFPHTLRTSLISLSSIIGAGPKFPVLRTRQKCTTMKAEARIGSPRNARCKPQQRVGIHNRPAQQTETHVVERRHAELRTEGTGVAQQRCRTRHVGSHVTAQKPNWSSGSRYPVKLRSSVSTSSSSPLPN